MAGVMVIEVEASNVMMKLHPSQRVLNKNDTRVTDEIGLTDPVATMWNNVLNPY